MHCEEATPSADDGRPESSPLLCGAQVVKVRAEAMSAAAAAGEPHGMLSVVGLADEDLGSLIQ